MPGTRRSWSRPPSLSLYPSFVFILILGLLISRVVLLLRSENGKDAEILALRHQLTVLQRQVQGPRFTRADRSMLAILAKALRRDRLNTVFRIVTPATVLGWHRRLVSHRWTYPSSRPVGRPPTPSQTRDLILRIDMDNPSWGYRRIHGEIRRLGHRVAASTVWKILRDHKRDPTPNRTGPTWSQFITAQAKGIVACDFLTVDTVMLRR